jgi:hypothetical protein
MNKLYFRIILVSSILIGLLAAMFDVFFPTILVSEVNDLILEREEQLSPFLNYISLGSTLVVGIVMIAAYIGMFLFQNWSRYSYIVAYLFMAPVYWLSGVFAFSGVAQFFYDISLIGSGVVLALAFTDPIRDYFKNDQT